MKTAWMRAFLLGLLSWLVPFLVGFALFPVKKADAALFTTILYLCVLVVAGWLMAFYFTRRPLTWLEAVRVGALWMVMNLFLDYPMFAFGPFKMTAGAYYSEIGLVYLTYPFFGLLAGRLAKR